MGIKGIYPEIGPGRRVALSKLACEKFEDTGRPLRIAVDVSIWLFQIQASKGGTNPALRTFYYRLLRLIALAIHPIFVFDGPNKPPIKRNKRTGGVGVSVASIPEFLAKQLLKQFGFPIHLAPGEAEAECALLQREGIVDAVLSEDVDTLMFGSGVTIRNWSPEQRSSKTPTHVNVYDAVETKNGPSGLDREGLVLVALMSGADYDMDGISKCGPRLACEAARAGFGRDLCRLARNDTEGLRKWRERLQHEVKTNEHKFFSQKRPSMKIPENFPRVDLLTYYAHPVVSNRAGLDRLRNSINWDQGIDFPGLRNFTHDAFDWAKLEGAKHFIRSLAPSLLVRHLRMRGEQIERFPTDDLQAIQEDESLLIKGIHGKRQHAVTDSTTELRVSFTPVELVKIDLSTEEPDDEVELPPGSEADLDEEIPLDMDDDAEGPKKRGPTKFDPYKPHRVWVLETYVKIGVPLKVQDWEAERQIPLKPKRAASAKDTSTTASKPCATRRTKTADNAPQPSIQNFAKVTKPGVRSSRARSKTPAAEAPAPATKTKDTVVSLLSSSPVKANGFTASQHVREKSLSPMMELPPSVTKRRRGPIQRAHTLPSNPTTALDRPKSPRLDVIETPDLVDLPSIPSPSQAPAKKARTRTTKKPASTRAIRATSVTASPGQKKQTTLDAWGSLGNSPSKPRKRKPAIDTTPIPPPPRFKAAEGDVETLDLTLSSPLGPFPQQPYPASNDSERYIPPIASRPALMSLSYNASNILNNSSSSTASKVPKGRTKLAPTSQRTSPRLHKSKPASPEIESLDLTQLLPPPASIEPSPVARPLSASAGQEVRTVSLEVESLDLTGYSSPPSVARSVSVPAGQIARTVSPEVESLNLTGCSSPLPAAKAASPPPAQQSDTPLRRSPRAHQSPYPEQDKRKSSPPAAWKTQAKKKREIVLRQSLAGAWTFIDAESPAKAGASDGVVLKRKERRRWRESEIEVLDLC
ncbi:hypothetical protein BU23DRAFT_550892 [Bimuria novae-zelandiae CBS 107.79]|uniref:Flap structure-specific endonuclease n=1 Tax=Bimuria novae-zelandiae CBS 107.79 TaxID=1447943 RepID=A0A6A5VL36_9PLEO|nr:hypothetical protein BU23DRAFT_550892 [Bimuria novae-zelandiae CBS 107.79]